MDFTMGYNALTGEYEDLMASGIIDPAKVVRSACKMPPPWRVWC
jgi:chaperonin GroEL